ncbi:MAG: GNAT family N-acetyltransferase [Candidatus Acidiferrales bacterium]
MTMNEQAATTTKLQVLDNPIWHALTTLQRRSAERNELAARFPPEVTLLAGMAHSTSEAWDSLARLLRGSPAAVFFAETPSLPDGWKAIDGSPSVQMICKKAEIPGEDDLSSIKTLGAKDNPEMLALAKLTKPGPFGTRTHELGEYIGIRESGRLAAMAGERLHLQGYTEVSAVCTHPDSQGRGYAGRLMSILTRKILQRGEMPILHVRQDNTSAIRLYEKLGFRTRRLLHFLVVLAG